MKGKLNNWQANWHCKITWGWFNIDLHGLTCWGRYECLLHLVLQNIKRDVMSQPYPWARKQGKSYNFDSDIISIGGLHTKLWAPKVVEVPTLGILGLGSLETKWHLGVGPMARHKIYYKGEGGGFPQVRAVVSLVSLCLLVVRPCTKMLQLRINQLVVWFLQVHVSNWITCQSS